MSNSVCFSIVIPTYNRKDLIVKTLESILHQSYLNFEVLIIDDGSTDNTKDVVENYINDNSLLNWHYYYKINEERGAARNYGVQKSIGQFITFLDSDDIFYENHLQIAYQFYLNNPKVEIFHSAYEFKNPIINTIKRVNYPKYKTLNETILKGNIMSCFGVFLKREIAQSHPFDEDRRLSGSEDWLLWLKLSAKFTITFQEKVTGCMIEHQGRSVLNFSKEQLKNRAEHLFDKLKSDKDFIVKFGIKAVKGIYAHMLTYGALHLMLSGKKKESVIMLISGLKTDYTQLFTKRTLAILKKGINLRKV